MRTAKQFSVGSVNKPGRLSSTLEALRREKVDLVALAVMDSASRKVLRFVPDDSDGAIAALESINVPFESHEVLLVELPNQPGAYSHLCERLAAGHLEMDYSYGTSKGSRGGGTAVVKVNDMTKAQRLLSEGNTNGAKKKVVRRPPVRARA